jgi:rhamnogalacturonan endolyase
MRRQACIRICALLVAALLQTNTLAKETFNRGLIAVVTDQAQVYLGWRLLEDDPADVAFNVYRRTDGGSAVRVNPKPLASTTNIIDTGAPKDTRNVWFVRPVSRGRELAPSETASLEPNAAPNRVHSIKLQGHYEFNRVGVCDLDGDGVFDYVIKQPGAGHGLDPGTIRPSPDTFKLEAYNGRTGEFMWRYDLGWNMNMGVWWTPFITADFDGDGKAEVALKMAPYARTKEEAVIAEGGFVLEGPEYLVVLNGMTGKETARANWVERGDPARWGDMRGNRVSRNQIGVATLDGKRQSILVARGTYTLMYVDAWILVGGKLVRSWRWFADKARTACTCTISTVTAAKRSRSDLSWSTTMARRSGRTVSGIRTCSTSPTSFPNGPGSRSRTATKIARRSTAFRSRMRALGR